jgi:hypothetical protein
VTYTLRFISTLRAPLKGPGGFWQIVIDCLRANPQEAGHRPASFFSPVTLVLVGFVGAPDTRARCSRFCAQKHSLSTTGATAKPEQALG